MGEREFGTFSEHDFFSVLRLYKNFFRDCSILFFSLAPCARIFSLHLLYRIVCMEYAQSPPPPPSPLLKNKTVYPFAWVRVCVGRAFGMGSENLNVQVCADQCIRPRKSQCYFILQAEVFGRLYRVVERRHFGRPHGKTK